MQKLSWLIPHFATDEGRLKMSIHALMLETPTRRIIVDTCVGNDKQRRRADLEQPHDPFLHADRAGFPPENIDTVLCTHLHVDHVGWNTNLVDGQWVPTFPNARYLFGRTEYEYWRDDQRGDPPMLAVFANPRSRSTPAWSTWSRATPYSPTRSR